MTEALFRQLLGKAETETLDFKSAQYRFVNATNDEKSELLKDILAFSNADRHEDAYILIGVEEVKGHKAIVRGISDHLEDSALQQFVCSKTNRPPVFGYSTFGIDGLSCGIIQLPVQKRPLFLLKDFGKLAANTVYIRRNSSTDRANPDEIAQMNAGEVNPTSPIFEIIVEPRIVSHPHYKSLELPMWIKNRGNATADDVVAVIYEKPVAGPFSAGYQTCSQTSTGHSGVALKLNNPLHPGDHSFLCSTELGQVRGETVATFDPVKFGVKIFARNQAPLDVVVTFTKAELFSGNPKTATRI